MWPKKGNFVNFHIRQMAHSLMHIASSLFESLNRLVRRVVYRRGFRYDGSNGVTAIFVAWSELRKWLRVTKCTHSRMVGLILEGNLYKQSQRNPEWVPKLRWGPPRSSSPGRAVLPHWRDLPFASPEKVGPIGAISASVNSLCDVVFSNKNTTNVWALLNYRLALFNSNTLLVL